MTEPPENSSKPNPQKLPFTESKQRMHVLLGGTAIAWALVVADRIWMDSEPFVLTMYGGVFLLMSILISVLDYQGYPHFTLSKLYVVFIGVSVFLGLALWGRKP
ncbi:MAG: hypothetical protein HY291_10270 [Planctomycetes bacterium]|nr:hypothetical protein [Planctomycetota bacterium]